MSDPLNINNEMRQFDLKNRNFYDSLTADQKKKISPFLMIRWGSSVAASKDVQEYYVLATNKRLNKWLFSIPPQHKKLQWLLATTVSPGIGVFKHTWIAPKKKESNNKHRKLIESLYPHLNDDEINLMCLINTTSDVNQYLKDLGED